MVTELALFLLSAGVVIFFLRRLKIRMDLNYNNRQAIIYTQTCTHIVNRSSEHDTPREDTIILLDVAAETYNESLRGKYADDLKEQPWQIKGKTNEATRTSEGRRSDSAGAVSAREESNRSARGPLDGSREK